MADGALVNRDEVLRRSRLAVLEMAAGGVTSFGLTHLVGKVASAYRYTGSGVPRAAWTSGFLKKEKGWIQWSCDQLAHEGLLYTRRRGDARMFERRCDKLFLIRVPRIRAQRLLNLPAGRSSSKA